MKDSTMPRQKSRCAFMRMREFVKLGARWRSMFVNACVFVLLSIIATTSVAGDCRKLSEVCVDGPSTKIINGQSVTRDCWEYANTFECAQPFRVDYCFALVSNGCTQTNSSCSTTMPDGSCGTYTQSYTCGTDVVPQQPGIVQLNSSYTVVSDKIDRSQCSAQDSNASCKLAKHECLRAEINKANGQMECVEWKDDFTCTAGETINYCKPLESAGCTLVAGSNQCAGNDASGNCNAYNKQYTCGTNNTNITGMNVVNLGTSYTLTQDSLDLSQCSSYKDNTSCTKASEKCIKQATSPDGKTYCETFEYSYTCTAGNYKNYCAPLQSIGCQETGSTCLSRTSDNKCKEYERTYSCTNKPAQSGENIVTLDTSYTLVSDKNNTSACDANANNPNCKLAGEVCVEGPATRTINGSPVTRDCWKWERQYSCTTAQAQNFCAALEQTGCKLTGSVCSATGANGTCNGYENTYLCDNKIAEPLPTKVEFLNTTYTITKDQLNTSACEAYKGANCQLARSTCTQPGGTRMINGLAVTKDCWESTNEYTCVGDSAMVSTCDKVRADSRCRAVSQNCVEYLPVGGCGITEYKYQCLVKDEEISTTTVCDDGSCFGGVCYNSKSPNDKDFAQVIARLEAGREAGVYVDQKSLEIFKGEAAQCTHKIAGVVNCCAANTQGATKSNAALGVAQTLVTNEVKRYLGSTFMYDTLFGSGLSSGILSLMYGTGSGASYGGVFAGGVNVYGITWSPIQGFGFDPYSFAAAVAIQVVQQYLQCGTEDQALAMKRGQDLCSYVGTYRTGFLSIDRKETWCCFNSKLARIINDSGRAQLGKSYGTARAPQCGGFTPDELTRIDFAKIDLSEFIRDITASSQDIQSLLNRSNSKSPATLNNKYPYFCKSGAPGC